MLRRNRPERIADQRLAAYHADGDAGSVI